MNSKILQAAGAVFIGGTLFAGSRVVSLALADPDPDADADACAGVAPPPSVVEVVIEQNPQRYTGPYCVEGETCESPADWDDREFLEDGSARHVLTYVGELRAVERNGAWESEELVMLPAPAPACWAWQWRKVEP